MGVRLKVLVVGLLAIVGLTALWSKTSSIDPEVHRQYDSALRELRSLDRTINQDVLRARFQLVDSYHPVLVSYRRIEELEGRIAQIPAYLDPEAKRELQLALNDYRAAVTTKQRLIERFKYQTSDLKELLAYLPGAGSGVAKVVLDESDQQLARQLNQVLQQTLLYNLTSDETYAPAIEKQVRALAADAEKAHSRAVKQIVRTFARNVARLLTIKPAVDQRLASIFAAPIVSMEDRVAAVYYDGHAAAERIAGRYRIVLYGACIFLLGLVGLGIIRLQASARALVASNERLEERVAERTRELNGRNAEMKAVLDNVEQALFAVDLAGNISQERSRVLNDWFPDARPGRTLWSMVAEFDPHAAAWIELGWQSLADDMLPVALILDQLPTSWTSGNRYYKVQYRPMGTDEVLERVLVVVSDVTRDVERNNRDADQREQLVVFEHFMTDKPGLMEFFAESARLAEEISQGENVDRAHLFRLVHTLKGNCALYGVASVARACHALESKMVNGDESVSAEELRRVADAWTAFADKIRSMVSVSSEERIEFDKDEFRSFRVAVADGSEPRELLRMLRHLQREPMERRLARIAEQAKGLSRRLGKGEVVVTTESHGVRLDARRWAPFWSSFVHMLRNALDHGIEAAEERMEAGKQAAGCLTLSTRVEAGNTVVEVTDDGRGIDWDLVRSRAQQLGIEALTEQELSDLLFRGGLSTKSEVTEYSGRGTGVAACFNTTRDLGGDVQIVTSPGQGTTFRFIIPNDDAVSVLSLLPPSSASQS